MKEKKVKKQSKNQKIVWILGFIIIILIGYISYHYFLENNTEIEIKNVEFKPSFQLSISKGCITYVNGTISNIGENIAEDVVVNCKVIGSGGNINGNKNLGYLNLGELKYFEMTINNDCPAPHDIECFAKCINCKGIVYG